MNPIRTGRSHWSYLWLFTFLSLLTARLHATTGFPIRFEGWLNQSGKWGTAATTANAQFAEGDAITLRYAGLIPAGTSNTVFLRLDHTYGDGTARFFDAFGSPAVNDATLGLGFSSLGSGVNVPLPDDPAVPGDQSTQSLRVFNATITGFGPYAVIDGAKVLPVYIRVTGTSGQKNVLIGYSGHFARFSDSSTGIGAAAYAGPSRKASVMVNADKAEVVSIGQGVVMGGGADIQVTQTTSAASVEAGSPATFTVVVQNAGPSPAQSVVLNNSLSSGVVIGTSVGSVSGGSVQIGTLNVGAKATITLQGTVPCGGLSNTATASSTTADPNSQNNSRQNSVVATDKTAPTLSGVPTLPVVAFSAPTECGAKVVLPVITALDTCDTQPVVTVTRADGLGLADAYPLGATQITCVAQDASGNRAEAKFDVVIVPLNLAWPVSTRLILPEPDPVTGLTTTTIEECIGLPSQSRWYKFSVQPGSRLLITLENVPENYDIVLYKDILQSFNQLTQVQSTGDLSQLNAEFAADAFAADAFSSEAFSGAAWSGAAWSGAAWSGAAWSGAAFSGAAWSPDVYAPDTFFGAAFSGAAFSGAAWSGAAWSADAVSGAAFSGAAWSGAAWSGAAWSGAAWSGAAFSGAAWSTEASSGAAWSGAAFSGAAFSDAQLRSIVGISAFPGIGNEAILANTWDNSGDFYVRVRGRNGAFAPGKNFKLGIQMITGACRDVKPLDQLPASTLVPPAQGAIKSLIVVDYQRLLQTSGDAAGVAAVKSALEAFAARPEIAGYIVDVGLDARVAAANAQADASTACATAKNIVAEAIREVINHHRDTHPEIETVTLVGNDAVIPFFRQPDQGLLANENTYVPPVLSTSASEAALKLGYFLTQDYYGTECQLSQKVSSLPIPDLGVGRLVETPAEILAQLTAYATATAGVIPTPTSSLVTGYDFLADAAESIRDELQAGIGVPVDELIQPVGETPETGWTADQLRAKFLGSRHDIIFLGGHFSAGGALAADYKTRMAADELANASVNLVNSIVFSAGCHSGYNIVNSDAVPLISPDPDWAQAFARKGAVLIAGTGYQYGDTEILEYSERLYLNFAKQLRMGTGPVALGKALARAKLLYLAETPTMRGLHEKALLQATLFGLPMLAVDLPSGRGTPSNTDSIVTSLTPAPIPGQTFGLKYADVSVQSTLSKVTRELLNVDAGGNTMVNASYFTGFNGAAGNPTEPLFPLEIRDVTVPGQVLRGVGFRSAVYSEEFDQIPFTSAPATELSSAHAPFLTDTLFPIRIWNVNYFDALCGAAGTPSEATRLFVMPAQYVSRQPGTPDGTYRKFEQVAFRLFYNNHLNTYQLADGTGVVAPALSAPPSIQNVSDVVSTANPNAQSVHFRVRVVGNPFAGLQEVWVTYTGIRGTPGYYGQWQSLNLTQPDPENDSTLWEGVLNVGSVNPGNLRYVVQAANGVGLVSLDTRLGAFYIPGGVSGTGTQASTLTIDPSTPSSAAYFSRPTLKAVLTSGGTPLAGQTINFALGTQEFRTVTDASGIATIAFQVLGTPRQYSLRVSYDGDDVYERAQASTPFAIVKQATQLSFAPTGTILVQPGVPTPFVADLEAAGQPLSELTVFFVFTPIDGTPLPASGAAAYYFPIITDYNGLARFSTLPAGAVPDGTYRFSVFFGSGIPGQPINAEDPRYLASDTAGVAQFGTVAVVVNDPAIAVSFPGNQTYGTSADGTGNCTTLVNLQTAASADIAGQIEVFYSVNGNAIPNPFEFPIGTTAVDAVAKVGDAVVATGSFTVTVVDDEAPVARARTVTAALNAGQTLTVTAAQVDNGSTDNCTLQSVQIGRGNLAADAPGFASSLTFSAADSGNLLVTLRAVDAAGRVSVASAVVQITRVSPIAISVIPSPSKLEEPDHKLTPVRFTVNAAGCELRQLQFRIVSISSNERLNGSGDGDRSPDWVFNAGPNSIFTEITSPSYSITETVRSSDYGWSVLGQNRLSASLRAERSGRGSGRVYTIRVEARDANGAVYSATCTVRVPKGDSDKD